VQDSGASGTGKYRLNLRIDESLIIWAQHYVESQGITLTSLLTDFLRGLRQAELDKNNVLFDTDVDQI
jgi:hypothetical protein